VSASLGAAVGDEWLQGDFAGIQDAPYIRSLAEDLLDRSTGGAPGVGRDSESEPIPADGVKLVRSLRTPETGSHFLMAER